MVASRRLGQVWSMMSKETETYADIAFPVRGDPLPLDHGYLLFSALSRVAPELHRQPAWGVHPVLGVRDGT